MPTEASIHLRGMLICLLALLFFAIQDAVTKVLVRDYPVSQLLLVRFWAFAVFATVFAALRGGVAAALRSSRPVLQIVRCALAVAEIGLFALAIRWLGLAEIHAIMAIFPLLVTVLAAPVLGEPFGWRRSVAVFVGFAGALIIIRPGSEVFGWPSIIALSGALLFAIYNVMTRLASRTDRFETSLFYLAWVGAISTAAFGINQWVTPDALAWCMLLGVSITGIAGHLLIIKALELTPASQLQPLNYSLLVWATLIGFVVFGELPDAWTIVGALVIAGSGLYTMFRERTRRGPQAVPNAMVSSAALSDDIVHPASRD